MNLRNNILVTSIKTNIMKYESSYLCINKETILIGYENIDCIIVNNNRIIKYDNDVYHIVLNNQSYIKFKYNSQNRYKVIYHDGNKKYSFHTSNVKYNRDIEYRNETLISNDIYSYILSYLGQTGSNEHISLACVTINPIDIIIKSYIKTEGYFDPLMISDRLNKRDLDKWNKIVNLEFIKFISSKPSIIFDILQSLRKNELL